MARLLHQTLFESLSRDPDACAIEHSKYGGLSYGEFYADVMQLAHMLIELGVQKNDRIGIFLDKQPLSAITPYAAAVAAAVFVPINPVLKAAQIEHIVHDCNIKVLVISPSRYTALEESIRSCPSLKALVFASEFGDDFPLPELSVRVWTQRASKNTPQNLQPVERPLIDRDMAAILYTSGSTGKPKGVVISHRNIVEGADCVSQYLDITSDDRLLAALPFSFDYGLNQLTSSIYTGASCVLLDYLLPRDVIDAVVKFRVTGLAGVPTMWAHLAKLHWPDSAAATLRYFTNTGGAMPDAVLASLRAALPNTAPYLMYGLTEAFRSTYLPPEAIDERPGSIGKAVPNAEILVVDDQGSLVGPNVPGELVHRGSLVALGYWNDASRTAERFRQLPHAIDELPLEEHVVFSGDTVFADEDGYIYFVGRSDAMIKTHGYRVSAEEIEEQAYAVPDVDSAAAIGVADPEIGQQIILFVRSTSIDNLSKRSLLNRYRANLPAYMIPSRILVVDWMPENANGKIDRSVLASQYVANSEDYPELE